jgi:Ca-activated chloride channel family protein
LLFVARRPRTAVFRYARVDVLALAPQERDAAPARARRTLGLGAWLGSWGLIGAVVAAFLAAAALTRPTVLAPPDPATTEGIDLVVALDVSGSMRAADFRPEDRMFVAKKVIAEQVLSRPRDRVGLVIFAGEAFTQAPLTHDKGLLKDVLEGVRTGVVKDGTAIGDGVATSLNRLTSSTAKTRAVILLTDGDNNAGVIAPESATELAVEEGVKIFPILVGKGGQVPFPDGTDVFGAPRYVTVEMPVNPALLKTIATRTGGAYFNATDEASLRSSLQTILDGLERSLLSDAPVVRARIPLSPPWLVLCAALVLTWLVLGFTRAARVP